jgi:hypothetical protein
VKSEWRRIQAPCETSVEEVILLPRSDSGEVRKWVELVIDWGSFVMIHFVVNS